MVAFGAGCVDGGGVAGVFIVNEIAIVVAEARNLNDLKCAGAGHIFSILRGGRRSR